MEVIETLMYILTLHPSSCNLIVVLFQNIHCEVALDLSHLRFGEILLAWAITDDTETLTFGMIKGNVRSCIVCCLAVDASIT